MLDTIVQKTIDVQYANRSIFMKEIYGDTLIKCILT